VKISTIGYALWMSVVAALLAGCGGGSQPPVAAPGTTENASKSNSYEVILRFGAPPRKHSRGKRPRAGLIDVGGTLYGTTAGGGGDDKGTVFSLTPAGAEKILYHFRGGSDAAHPAAPLLDVGGTLYGTSPFGGGGCFGTYDAGCGTVFSVTMGGVETVLHRFTGGCNGCTDGANPYSALIDVKGALYGTTPSGGRGNSTSYYCCGTVYRFTAAGKYEVVYRFCKVASCPDGTAPYAGLIDVNGTLYGATAGGGKYGAGTVFSLSTTGEENVVYSFPGGSGGVWPEGTLIAVNGTLYGTTIAGGTGSCYVNGVTGCGIVYGVTPSGSANVLYRFGGGTDGAYPNSNLTSVNGAFFGTTPYGGSGDCKVMSSPNGCGVVYELTASGSESILHDFTSGTDGATPEAGLTYANSTLYGTTPFGGEVPCKVGCGGTIFSLTP
jgi:uncharacterized repeat protein (TIGR03803 family)